MSKRGAKIIMACRNLELAEKAAEELRGDAGAEIVVKKLDLANLASIREFAKEVTMMQCRISSTEAFSLRSSMKAMNGWTF